MAAVLVAALLAAAPAQADSCFRTAQGVTHYGLELVDVEGRFGGWYSSVPPDMDDLLWQERCVRPDVAAPQGFDDFATHPDFDVTQVTAIQFAVATPGGTTFGDNPIGGDTAWAAWGHVEVAPVPEPISVVSGLIGLGMIGGYVRRRRARR